MWSIKSGALLGRPAYYLRYMCVATNTALQSSMLVDESVRNNVLTAETEKKTSSKYFNCLNKTNRKRRQQVQPEAVNAQNMNGMFWRARVDTPARWSLGVAPSNVFKAFVHGIGACACCVCTCTSNMFWKQPHEPEGKHICVHLLRHG